MDILNENDRKLLAYCFNIEKHLSDIARHIGIDVKNVSTRIHKLEQMGLIKVFRVKNKKYVRTIEGDKTKGYMLDVLQELNKNNGLMKEEDFFKLIPFNPYDESNDKFFAPSNVLFSEPKLVDVYVKINSNGLKFIKEFSNKK